MAAAVRKGRGMRPQSPTRERQFVSFVPIVPAHSQRAELLKWEGVALSLCSRRGPPIQGRRGRRVRC
jgi:hypothetical protein